ncbi:MAG: hypothetical protein Q8Q09_19250 [Deltaproteobacteria bacterium]|nr:hypothetical protein [Deltaproteobacteria bacterium]
MSPPQDAPVNSAKTLPKWRRIGAFATLAIGAIVVTQSLKTTSARDSVLSVSLADWREGPRKAHTVSLAIVQENQVLRHVAQRYERSAVPARWSTTVNLPPGDYDVRVEVTSDVGIASREQHVHLEGTPVQLRAPGR